MKIVVDLAISKAVLSEYPGTNRFSIPAYIEVRNEDDYDEWSFSEKFDDSGARLPV